MPQRPDDRSHEVANAIEAVVHGDVVQAGSIAGGVHVHHHRHGAARPVIAFPHRAGVVPPRAAAFQNREASQLLAPMAYAGRTTVVISGGGGSASVVSGLGGVGKTQLVVDFAETLWAAGEVDLLVWITAGSSEAVVSGYARLAVDLTGIDDDDPAQSAGRLLEWLATTSARWLVVLDDLRSPGDLHGLWPPITATGRAVVTTRRRDAALRGHQRQLVEIGVFTSVEAHTYLRAALADQAHLLDDVGGLAANLGYLPLALAQAAAYMLDRNLSCNKYRTRLADRRRTLASLLPEGDELPDEHRATVAATWSLSIEQANRLEPRGLAAPLLQLASLLDANGIPAEVFDTPAVLIWLSATVGRDIGKDDVVDGLGCLHRLSLITAGLTSSSRAVRVHALVQRATRDSLAADLLPGAVRTVADALAQAWPKVERDAALGQILRANADTLYRVGEQHLWEPNGHAVLFQAGISLGTSGLVAAARDYFRRLHATAADRLGADHLDTLTARQQAARWRAEAGDPTGAITAFEDLLVDRQRVSGAEHPDTLAVRHDIAYWQGHIDDPAVATAALEHLLTDQLRALGPDHIHTLNTRGDIAHRKGKAGDPAAAATAYEDLLVDRRRALGPDHLDTLHTRRELARWHGEAGDPTAAVTTLEHLLADQLRVLGPDHPHTLDTRRELARWHGEAGDPAAAVTALERLMVDRLRVLGADHPRTLETRDELARWRGRTSQT